MRQNASISGAKRHPNEPKKGPTVAIVIPMLQKIAKDAPQSIMSSEDWIKCLRYVAGQRRPGQLYLTQAIQAERPLSEALDELSPPIGIQDMTWRKFRSYTKYIADEIHKSRKAGVDLPKRVEANPPKTPDMLIKAEWSLSMPCQKDKTSSTEGCQ